MSDISIHALQSALNQDHILKISLIIYRILLRLPICCEQNGFVFMELTKKVSDLWFHDQFKEIPSTLNTLQLITTCDEACELKFSRLWKSTLNLCELKVYMRLLLTYVQLTSSGIKIDLSKYDQKIYRMIFE